MSNLVETTTKEVLESYVKNALGADYPRFQNLSSLLRTDLFMGPIYYIDEQGDPRFWGDEPEADNNWAEWSFVDAVQELRQLLGHMSNHIYVDVDSGSYSTSEPVGYEEDGEWIEPCWESIYEVQVTDVVGTTLKEYL